MESHLHDVNIVHNVKLDPHLHDVPVAHIKMDSHLMHEAVPHNIKMHDGSHNVKLDLHEVPITHSMKMDGHIQVPVNHIPHMNQNNQIQQNVTQNVENEPENLLKPRIEKKKKEAIDGQAREIIYKVIKFFESEKQNRGYAFPVENVVKRACAATGLSESTIKRIKREGIRAEATHTKMAGPKKKRVRKTKVQLDYFQLCALRGIVNSYSMRKEVPTLGKILTAAKHELNYRGGKESLRLILLNKLGIKFKKCEKKNKKPPEPNQTTAIQPMPNVMSHLPMQQMKPENQCIYSNMMPQVPPVSY
ncbi:unnamed protein product [Danaus chrysippus]|uniref:(African queen) hypothetical protein n=1 Tax=Danaus chrysippus TaxID=151541 RepID=A0A8J2R3P8_9NEOP|nr:unnamed protein product [Danaus chrysippus]